VVSTADANGPLGRTLLYFNCDILPILKGVSEVNSTVNLLVGLLKPPTGEECKVRNLPITLSERGHSKVGKSKDKSGTGVSSPFSGLEAHPLGAKQASKSGSRSTGGKN
jgi:hypothetical protein